MWLTCLYMSFITCLVYQWTDSGREHPKKVANQKRMLGDMAIEGGNLPTAYFKQVLRSSVCVGENCCAYGNYCCLLLERMFWLYIPAFSTNDASDTTDSYQLHSYRPETSIPLALTLCMFFPKQTIRELFDMPLEEPSGSSVPSAPDDEEETVASKQTHILEQVKKRGQGIPYSPVIKTLRFHCRSSIPGQGTEILPCRKRVDSP